MLSSSCTISFFSNNLQISRLWRGQCPVKKCKVDINQYKVPFQKYKGKMKDLPFCPEHGLRIHKGGFVYYNGSSGNDLIISTKRNLIFHSDYYVANFLKKGNKMEAEPTIKATVIYKADGKKWQAMIDFEENKVESIEFLGEQEK